MSEDQRSPACRASPFALYSGGGIAQTFTYTSKGELETAVTTQANMETAMPGRSLSFTYDAQGNRKSMGVDGQASHTYTPGPANEYTAVTYGAHVASISGMAVNPGQVVVGDEFAERAVRQGEFFYRGYKAQSDPWWSLEGVYAAEPPPPGGFAAEFSRGEKEVYLPPEQFTPKYDEAGNLTEDGWVGIRVRRKQPDDPASKRRAPARWQMARIAFPI